ncbi:MAG: FecR family protein [Chitinophagaceae bacterium]|nr:FecR family protein [Chitinophagaceae bacterium]MCW5926890.1 FecR family protein [Chitinophagaceae bacterium]
MTIDRIWYILGKKLTNEASSEELRELGDLLRRHPELHYPIQNILDLWKVDKPRETLEARQALQHHLLRLQEIDGDIQPVNRPFSRRKYKLAFAVIVVAICAGFYFVSTSTMFDRQPVAQNNSRKKSWNEVSTKPGSHSRVVLPDGSIVWLNAESRLEYDKEFNNLMREVRLDGEAFFDVKKDSLRPFIIHTNKIDIRVLGTEFNVKSYSKDSYIETSLIRGAIEVSFPGKPAGRILMKPSEKLVVKNENMELLPAGSVTDGREDELSVIKTTVNYQAADSAVIETLWLDNRLVFRNRPFVDLVPDLSRRYGFVFQFEKESPKALMFDGNFKNESVFQALEALQLANHFSYYVNKDTIFIK